VTKGAVQVSQRRGDLAVAAFLLGVAIFFIWGAWRMPAGSFAVPGPGTVPLIIGSLLALTGLAIIVKTLRARPDGTPVVREMRIAPIVIVFAALAGVAVALERLGFIITMSVFLFVMLRVFSRLSTLRSAIAAVAISALANWLFVNLLGVTLPHW
jgi:hypothetical protein